jgi:hypothetical protein
MTGTLNAALRATLLFVAPTLVVCLCVLELGLRALGRPPSNTTEGIYEQKGTGYGLKPNMTKLSRAPAFSYVIHTDANGFRAPTPGPRPLGPNPWVAFVGDSITFGNGVAYQDSFVGVFAEEAGKRGLGVVNLAVGGHRFSDQEDRLQEVLELAPRKPAAVVVVFTSLFVWAFDQRDRGLIVVNGHLFTSDSWRVKYLRVLLGDSSSAYCLFRDGIRKLQERASLSRSQAFLEPLQIFARDAPNFGPAVEEQIEQRLARLDERIVRAGATPIYVYMPNSADLRVDEFLALAGHGPDRYDFLRYHDILRRHCERAGIRLVDLLPLLERRKASGARLAFAQDPHYDAPTNHVIGEALRDAILRGGDPVF